MDPWGAGSQRVKRPRRAIRAVGTLLGAGVVLPGQADLRYNASRLPMSWLTVPRKPEPEVMGEADEVQAYASAAAQAYLSSLDDTWVDQVIRTGGDHGPASAAQGPLRGWLLDVGTGPGGIPLKLVRLCPSLRAVGVDRSLNMVREARQAAAEQGLG